MSANIVVLAGRLARPAEMRELPSGDHLVAYELTVPREGARAESVPVVWFEAPASAADHDVDDQVVVIGRVRRRFFRAGGSTQSRTEVVADAVVAARQVKRVRTAVGKAQAALVGLAAAGRT
ncbi:MAG: single-stranded DNA-binding protein [Actinomycetota bacterium]|nr:single-stranded DNA-binding protein [Actinomycetota bacterium]